MRTGHGVRAEPMPCDGKEGDAVQEYGTERYA